MPRRKIVLAENEVYHVFNRGVMKMPVFLVPTDYNRFLELLSYYRFQNTPKSYSDFKKLPVESRLQIMDKLTRINFLSVEILAYCLMPNHFHLMLRQVGKNGIGTFMGNVLNGYTKYFNIKNHRVGPLWQAMFSAIRIEDNEQFVHTCRYIHLNPSTAYLVETDKLDIYAWSSYPEFIGKRETSFLEIHELSSFFKSKVSLVEFTLDQADYQKKLSEIKHLTFDCT